MILAYTVKKIAFELVHPIERYLIGNREEKHTLEVWRLVRETAGQLGGA